MKLTAVIYELFASDLEGLSNASDLDSHEIDREIKLLFDDASPIYISWCSKPIQYAVGYQNKSWFNPPPEITLEATNWPLWQPLIGQEISFTYLDKDHQVLRIKSLSGSVFCSSFEEDHWLADVLHIAATPLVARGGLPFSWRKWRVMSVWKDRPLGMLINNTSPRNRREVGSHLRAFSKTPFTTRP